MPASARSSTSSSAGPADILERAVEIGDRDGWCKHRLQDGEGRRCAIGLLAEARIELKQELGEDNVTIGYLATLSHLTAHVGVRNSEAIPRWNDMAGRTWGEVRDALLETAKEIRNDA